MPKLSVIVPNFNREALIGETLTNLLAQTRPPDELIVIDDGSTDGSAEVIAGFGKAVTLLRQANAGPAVARNKGLAAASGEFVQFFDSDDLCSLDKLELQSRALAASDAPFVYGPWLQARLANGIASYDEPVLQQRGLPASRTALSWYLRGWVIVFQCCMFRRSVLDAVGHYREDLMPTEDSELLFRILANGHEPVHVPGALVLYRLHPGHQISGGGMATPRRAADWSRFLGVVADQLADIANVAQADRERWRWLQREAAADLARLDLAAPALPEPGLVSRLQWQADRLARAVGKRVSRRIDGSTFPAQYGQAPLTVAQEVALGAIGYTAVRP